MDKTKVSTGKPKITGAIYRAPLGTTIPTDATSALDAAYKELGYVSEDGVTNGRSSDSNSVQAWGGDTVINARTGMKDTFNFTLIEGLNTEVLKVAHGETNVTGTLAEGITVTVNDVEDEPHIWVFDMILKGAIKRLVIPIGTVEEVGEVNYTDSDAIGYAITLDAAKDSAGNTHYEYIKAKTATANE